MQEKNVMLIILVLCMAGIGLATFLVADHYQIVPDVCEINSSIGCGEVNRGPYSTIIGIPWSIIGLVGFILIFGLAYLRLYYPELDRRNRFIPFMIILSWLGVISIIYLNYLELFVIGQICPFCAMSHLIMIVLFFLIQWWYFYGRKKLDPALTETP